MRGAIFILLLAMLTASTAFAGFGAGVYLEPSLIRYDGIDAGTLDRERQTTPAIYLGLQGVVPILSGAFLSARVGGGFTLERRQNATTSEGERTVKTHLREIRGSLRLNALAYNGMYGFVGGGYSSTRLRFAGDIPEINADSDDPFAEAGIGRMLNDKHFLGLSASFLGATTVYSFSYSFFFFYTGY